LIAVNDSLRDFGPGSLTYDAEHVADVAGTTLDGVTDND
jgi:hypothetical protein